MKTKHPFMVAALSAEPAPAPQWKPGEALPKSVKLLNFGDNPSTKGNFRVTQETIDGLSAFQKAKGREHVVIDVEHSTLQGSPAYLASTEPRPVVARKAQVVVLADKSIGLDAIEWNDGADKTAANYADISPALTYVKDLFGKGIHWVCGILSAGLVRQGALYDVAFCSADGLNPADPDGDGDDDSGMDDLIAMLVSMGVLPAGATPNDVAEWIKGLLGSIAELRQAHENLKSATAGLSAETTAAISTAIKPLQDQVAALSASDTKRAKEHLCAMARMDGKVIPLTAEVIEALTVDAFATQLKALKAGVVPLMQRTVSTGLGADNGAGATSLTEERRKIAALVGVDPAKVKWD